MKPASVIVTVDRIEDDIAVLEVGDEFVDWPLTALPLGVEEGMRLVVRFEVQRDLGPAEA